MNWLLYWVGGSIGRVAGAGVVFGIFLTLFGVTPGEAVASLLATTPAWLINPWFKFFVLILGLVIIYFSFRFNLWSKKQEAIDDLAEDISWAIHNLLNLHVNTDEELNDWEKAYRDWCNVVSDKLGNRAFFTKADQLHFDRLGFIQPVTMPAAKDEKHNWLLSQLRLKFDRLREVINWVQMRRR